ncbi:hypothetical protein ACT3TS_06980 [Specibacter sp. AOP5-B1-6]|uniref:hypothetical protein n=1 Tax=Specibacter sp. AOP5-B1-6 TaxID=3457653 RepID=UPI00402B8632
MGQVPNVWRWLETGPIRINEIPEMPIAQQSIGFIAETDEQARELHWPYWGPVVTQIGRERGFYPPTKERYLQELDEGALYVGGVETVAQKMTRTVRTNHLSRFDLKYDVRHLPRQARTRQGL